MIILHDQSKWSSYHIISIFISYHIISYQYSYHIISYIIYNLCHVISDMQKPQVFFQLSRPEGLSQISMTEVNTRLRIVYISTGSDAERFDAVPPVGFNATDVAGGWWRVGCWETDETKVIFLGWGDFEIWAIWINLVSFQVAELEFRRNTC